MLTYINLNIVSEKRSVVTSRSNWSTTVIMHSNKTEAQEKANKQNKEI
jgi:hypothetical protein